MLDFTPTPAEEAFKTTLAWYEEAFVKFPSQRDSILTDLFQTAVPKENRFSEHFYRIGKKYFNVLYVVEMQFIWQLIEN